MKPWFFQGMAPGATQKLRGWFRPCSMMISFIIRAKGRTQGKMEKAKITGKGL
jgi:hypothetical protein